MTVLTLWDLLKKEVIGIELLWETVERLYLAANSQGIATLTEDVPLLYRLTQTAMMESLLIRMSRLMDPAASGRGGEKTNLSLNRLAEACSDTADDIQVVRDIWDDSNLKHVRDKYLSHNDLARSLSESHTLNIPLNESDVAAMRKLVSGLREFRRKVHGSLNPGVAYLDASVERHVQRETETLNRTLLGSKLFFKLLPEHETLQRAWQGAGHG